MANPDQNSRDSKGHYVRTPETAARDAQAADLYSQGHTYQQIAELLGYADKGGARLACKRVLREIIKGPGEKLLALHVERLEALYETARDVMEADHVVVSHGKVVTMLDEETQTEKPLTDNGPKLQALREARATLESFRKLMGLDQPTQVAVSGNVRYEVVGLDPKDLT